jgi:hypothetical protein
LYPGFVGATSLVGPGESTLWLVGGGTVSAFSVAVVRVTSIPCGIVDAVPGAIETVHPWVIALDVAKWGLVILRNVPYGIHARDAVNPRTMEVPDTVFGLIMDECSDSVESQVVREDPVVVRVTVRIDTGLKGGDDVRIFRRCDGTKEDGGTVPRREEHILFGLEAEV